MFALPQGKLPNHIKCSILSHEYFKNFSKINFLTSIRPGKKVGDPTVQNLRALKYTGNGEIYYKLRHSDHWKELPVRLNQNPDTNISQLYNERLKIKRDKFENLQASKQYMPIDYHAFYDEIPHE